MEANTTRPARRFIVDCGVLGAAGRVKLELSGTYSRVHVRVLQASVELAGITGWTEIRCARDAVEVGQGMARAIEYAVGAGIGRDTLVRAERLWPWLAVPLATAAGITRHRITPPYEIPRHGLKV